MDLSLGESDSRIRARLSPPRTHESSKKKDFFSNLDWKEEWIASVDDHFDQSFNIYNNSTTSAPETLPQIDVEEFELTDYLKRRKCIPTSTAENEITRYFLFLP